MQLKNKKRLRGIMDQRKTDHHKKRKGEIHCSFCLEIGHNKATCSELQSMGIVVKFGPSLSVVLEFLNWNQSRASTLHEMIKALPENMGSLIVHSAGQLDDGTSCILVCVLGVGPTCHHLLSSEKEPYPITRELFCSVSYNNKSQGLLVIIDDKLYNAALQH